MRERRIGDRNGIVYGDVGEGWRDKSVVRVLETVYLGEVYK